MKWGGEDISCSVRLFCQNIWETLNNRLLNWKGNEFIVVKTLRLQRDEIYLAHNEKRRHFVWRFHTGHSWKVVPIRACITPKLQWGQGDAVLHVTQELGGSRAWASSSDAALSQTRFQEASKISWRSRFFLSVIWQDSANMVWRWNPDLSSVMSTGSVYLSQLTFEHVCVSTT